MSDVFVAMTFDPDLEVNVHSLIRVLRGQMVVRSPEQWEDMKEQIADCLEQLIELRMRVEELKRERG